MVGMMELLNSILVRTDDGQVGIRVVRTTKDDCANVTDFLSCSSPLVNLEDVLRNIIVLDECGRPGVHMIDVVE